MARLDWNNPWQQGTGTMARPYARQPVGQVREKIQLTTPPVSLMTRVFRGSRSSWKKKNPCPAPSNCISRSTWTKPPLIARRGEPAPKTTVESIHEVPLPTCSGWPVSPVKISATPGFASWLPCAHQFSAYRDLALVQTCRSQIVALSSRLVEPRCCSNCALTSASYKTSYHRKFKLSSEPTPTTSENPDNNCTHARSKLVLWNTMAG